MHGLETTSYKPTMSCKQKEYVSCGNDRVSQIVWSPYTHKRICIQIVTIKHS